MKKFNFAEIENYLANISVTSKIYIGCDSMAYKNNKGVWMADYYKVIVVHKDASRGCKIFGEVSTEMDYTPNKKKPNYRLMNECYKVSELYLQLAEMTDKEIEVHLDFNPNKKFASNLIIEQAIGYIKGTCNVIPLVKPDAFAASYAADRLLRVAG